MDLFDILVFIGILLLGIGLWLVAPALSLSVVGALLLLVGLLGAKGPRPPRRPPQGGRT
jgi:uncharacterized membrane protein